MELPTIPKKTKRNSVDEIVYNSRVKMTIPEKKEEKALVLMKIKKEKLMTICKNEVPFNYQKGSHSKEAGTKNEIINY
ncbi:unnamed protein product [Meloidogyne enterolobii]|uniref:Uncharacterized protein n=1 Tax=Meloidogyne enterolobii TaxID=390850 RepID=A0ACB1A994_MELEN